MLNFPCRTAALLLPLCALTPFAQAQETTLAVGGALAVRTDYPGASQRRVAALPLIDWQSGNVFASTLRGLGVQARADAVTLSAALNVDPGRADRKRSFRPGADRLAGMGDIDAGAVLDLSAGWSLADGTGLQASTRMAAKRAQGNQYALRGTLPLLAGAAGQLGVAATLRYADRRRMQTWFGVTPAQHAASGFAAYAPDAGGESQSLALTARGPVGGGWAFNAEAGVQRLGSQAAASPLTERRSAPYLLLALLKPL